MGKNTFSKQVDYHQNNHLDIIYRMYSHTKIMSLVPHLNNYYTYSDHLNK